MKKILLLIAALMLLASCNSQMEQNEVQPNSEMSNLAELSESLQNYNSLFITSPSAIAYDSSLRGFWGWIGKIGRVIASDAVGAIVGSTRGGVVGSIVVGVSASVGAIIGLQNVSHDGSLYMYTFSIDSSGFSAEEIEKLDEANDIGYLHNAIIYNLFNTNPNILNYSDSEVRQALFNIFTDTEKIPELKKINYYFSHQDKENILSQFQLGQDVAKKIVDDELISKSDFIKTISQSASISREEAQILADYCIVVSQMDNIDEISNYAQGYNEIVLKSNTSDRVKCMIMNFTSVATNSRLLWSNML